MFSLGELPFSLFFNTGRRLGPNRHQYNRWLPSEIGGYLLTGSSTVTIEKTTLKLNNRQLNSSDWHLSYYEVNGIIPPSTKAYLIQPESRHTSYVFEILCDSQNHFNMRNLVSTFLIVENGPPQDGRYNHGAIFYAFSSQVYDKILVFHCPARIRKLHRNQTLNVQHKYSASIVSGRCNVHIMFGMHY